MLDFVHQRCHAVDQPLLRYDLLFERVAAHQFDRAVFQIARAERQPHRHAFEFVFGELEARTDIIARVDLDAQSACAEFGGDRVELGDDRLHLLLALVDRDEHRLDRRERRRQHQPVVVRMGHDERSHQAGRDAPRRGPHVFELALLVGELHVERLGEILPQKVRRTALQRLAVLHQRLDRERVLGACEPFVGRLVAHDHGQGHVSLGELLVDVYHLRGLGDRLLARLVGGVPLLPQEFGRAEEQARAHLPAHDVGPLVAQDRQVAVGVDPVLIGIPDDRLRRRAHDQFLFEPGVGIDHHALAFGIVFQPVVRHYGALLGEAFDVVRLLREEGLGDEEREVGVLVARLLEHPVQNGLHLLPDGITVGFDDHAAADGRVLGQAGLHDQIVVPLRVVLLGFGQIFEFFCHMLAFRYFPSDKISKINRESRMIG